jgi:hypothetical protein
MQHKVKEKVFHIAGQRRLGLSIIIAVVLLFFAGMSHAQVFDRIPFRISTELEAPAPSDVGVNIPAKDSLVLPAEFYSDRNPKKNGKMLVASDNGENILSIYMYRRIRLYMSRLATYEKDIDARREKGNTNDKMETVMMLPSMLSNDQYKDTFKSIGKIFEPRLSLEIEF